MTITYNENVDALGEIEISIDLLEKTKSFNKKVKEYFAKSAVNFNHAIKFNNKKTKGGVK